MFQPDARAKADGEGTVDPMSDTTATLRRKIASAGELQSVVRTMKALAAASIGQYEKSVLALTDYYRTVELGLGVCLREEVPPVRRAERKAGVDARSVGAVVFGSDQGLVGPFNELVVDSATKSLAALPGSKQVWAVGERVYARLTDAGIACAGVFAVPTSVGGITSLVGRILVTSEAHHAAAQVTELHLFFNRRTSGALYAPSSQRLLPLDELWRDRLARLRWPEKRLPEVIGDRAATLRSLIRSYLFVSIFRACAESLSSENASRLAAMQRADKNIEDLLETLQGTFHQLRQTGIDEELFDVISGFEFRR
jgi:F-type H+-transporting ATPase subunit gamma